MASGSARRYASPPPENGKQLWVPPGFAPGFCSLEPDTVICYKVTGNCYSPECDKGLAWDDPVSGIAWYDVADATLFPPRTASSRSRPPFLPISAGATDPCA